MLAGKGWMRNAGASEADLNALKNAVSFELPDSYLALLRWSDGGEGPLPVQPLWLVLYPAAEVVQIESEGAFKEFFGGLFVVGGNGGGEAIALDCRGESPFPVVCFDMTNIDLNESIWPIAASFDDALALIGVPE